MNLKSFILFLSVSSIAAVSFAQSAPKATCSFGFSYMALDENEKVVVKHREIDKTESVTLDGNRRILNLSEQALEFGVFADIKFIADDIGEGIQSNLIIAHFYQFTEFGSKRLLLQDTDESYSPETTVRIGLEMNPVLAETLLNNPQLEGTHWPVEMGVLPNNTIKYFQASCRLN